MNSPDYYANAVRSPSLARRVTVVGIDPAATTGLVALSVDAARMGNDEAWRWVDHAAVSKSTRTHATRAENTLAMLRLTVPFLTLWAPYHVAIERPADIGVWIKSRGGQKQRGQSTGTAFALGEAYGVLLGACASFQCRVFDYPVTSRKARPGKPERVGWMPQRSPGFAMSRDALLDQLHRLSVTLRAHPQNGMLGPGRTERLDENILMALGVLRFHLSRQLR